MSRDSIRMRQTENLHELKVELRTATDKANEARDQLQALQTELSGLENENTRLRQLTTSDEAGKIPDPVPVRISS